MLLKAFEQMMSSCHTQDHREKTGKIFSHFLNAEFEK